MCDFNSTVVGIRITSISLWKPVLSKCHWKVKMWFRNSRKNNWCYH